MITTLTHYLGREKILNWLRRRKPRAGSLEYWEARCADLEQTLLQCAEAFELIPVWTLERDEIWMPSDVAILRIKNAKDGVRSYLNKHNGNGFH